MHTCTEPKSTSELQAH